MMRLLDPDRSWGAVVAADTTSPGRYLLVQHRGGGHWDHPKGHPEGKEEPKETARREVREETGFTVELLPGFYKEIQYTLPGGRPKIVGFFLGIAQGEAGEQLTPEEIDTTAWFPWEEALDRVTYPAARELLQAAEAFLRSSSPGTGRELP